MLFFCFNYFHLNADALLTRERKRFFFLSHRRGENDDCTLTSWENTWHKLVLKTQTDPSSYLSTDEWYFFEHYQRWKKYDMSAHQIIHYRVKVVNIDESLSYVNRNDCAKDVTIIVSNDGYWHYYRIHDTHG